MNKLAPIHKLPKVSTVDREGFILERCRGKRVLHLGCAAWPFTARLFEKGQLLHQKLEKVCSELVGIDISQDGISFLQNRGVNNLFISDASKLKDISCSLGWIPELIVAGEIIEHIDTPGLLLRECACYMPSDCTLLITVPNAYSIKGFLHIMLGREKVNTDHVSYYSYTTMVQLLTRCGLEVVDTQSCKECSNNLIGRAIDVLLLPLLWLRPFLGDGFIICCHQSQRQTSNLRLVDPPNFLNDP